MTLISKSWKLRSQQNFMYLKFLEDLRFAFLVNKLLIYVSTIVLDPPICSHVMSGAYFAETITSTSFIGVECVNEVLFYFGYCQMSVESTAIMGEHVDLR